MKTFRILVLGLLFTAPGMTLAQSGDEPSTAVIQSMKGLHGLTTGNLLKTAEMLDDAMYAYRPTEEVRTSGQLLAHVANAQFMFCSIAVGEENPSKVNFEETATTKADIIAALTSASEYCAGVYDRMTDEKGAETRDLFGRMQMAASAVLAFNSTHNYEHYGNLVTYMRINGLVPPSSQ